MFITIIKSFFVRESENMNKIHKILSYECKDLSILTHQLNKDIDNYDNWKTD
ncbi:hypothetical protein B4092_4854 [Bacillus licheniformis]|nr:hypothetical protein B4092_4854 [Bacillus licheniformis]TWM14806.1 hypothetical protein CHCC15091_1847 [Bacillus licheniformis]